MSIKDTRTVHKHLRTVVLFGSSAGRSRYGCLPSWGRVRRSDMALRGDRPRNGTRRLIRNRVKGITIKFIKRAAHILQTNKIPRADFIEIGEGGGGEFTRIGLINIPADKTSRLLRRVSMYTAERVRATSFL